MHLYYRNVNSAFRELIAGFNNGFVSTIETHSRNGPVMQAIEPMTITYSTPTERVLLNIERDCNPFFHMFESLWMLAGRADVAPLAHYNSNIANYSDDGKTFHGAYGYRWRKHFGYDQLAWIADELFANPGSRRCVLQAWDVKDDLQQINDRNCSQCNGTGVTPETESIYCKYCSGTGIRKKATKDVPCNTEIFFSIIKSNHLPVLDMTVCNRSNDLVWGMLGANVVHMSMLQEYMAACIGINVGHYNQFTNNLHVYKDKWMPEKWLGEYEADYLMYETFEQKVPLVSNPEVFDKECEEFIDNAVNPSKNWQEPFLQKVASPMCWAFNLHKKRMYEDALRATDLIEDDAWRIMSRIWIQKRKNDWKKHV